MKIIDIVKPLNEVTEQIIRKELNEDPERLKRQIELFNEWLRCEPYLPNEVDAKLVRNYLRYCKCDLEKAKKKFENFLLVRVKLKRYYSDRIITDSYFHLSMKHRLAAVVPQLTPDGYRIGIGRLPKDVSQYDFEEVFHYCLVLLDFFLIEDECAGVIGVTDLGNLTAQHLGKMSIKLLAEATNIFYNVNPMRYKAQHFLNVPHIPETLIALMKKIVPQKIVDRTYAHKNPENLADHIPRSLIPKEYGGQGLTCDELGDNMKAYLINYKGWEEKASKLKLTGPIPHHKRDLYSFDDFEMGGSFRQLSID